ncbi:LamG-like jellyroll fold domain-containing protein [Ferruginibacter albus]|uniref:LamG-like jellyroll fold domain-containing protein n=1 Tax=Ferruginibacter albus TaxID=2875540 RepID=UPI001CC6E7F7|nr:LamG-like jellyroll fold domain-containing protein [Ferruginibacter albus]UAY53107.1 gliding motility-associated C-terminal domain-containing protein [Ferruginibacter albus]
MKRSRFLIFFLFIIFSICNKVNAQISFTAAPATTVSTCANNGSIQIFAQSLTGSLFYAITNGPVTVPAQTSSLFTSLPAGIYTVEVTSTTNEIKTTTVSVLGTYQQPKFTPIVINPRCPAAATGTIIGNIDVNTGRAPYTWELIPPSIETRPQQANDTFKNLLQGNYTLQLTDACNNVQQTTVALFTPSVNMTSYGITGEMTGCDTAKLQLIVGVTADLPPYKLTYTVAGTNYTIDTVQIASNLGNTIYPVFTVPNLSYGGTIDNVVLTNACGTQLNFGNISLCAFAFSVNDFRTIPGDNCGPKLRTDFGYDGSANPLCTGMAIKNPTAITIKDALGNVVESKVYSTGDFHSDVLLPNTNYSFTIRDSCGHQFSKSFTTQNIDTSVSFSINKTQEMLDSAGILYITERLGMPAVGVSLTILDGPAFVQSTKPGFAYKDKYTFPKTFIGQINNDSSVIFSIYNTGVGTYHYVIKDTCGNQHVDSLVVKPNDVASLYHNYEYISGCVGESGLKYEFLNNGGVASFSVVDIKTGSEVYSLDNMHAAAAGDPTQGVVNNLTASDYALNITYTSYVGSVLSMNDSLVNKLIVRDTIHIAPYQSPAFKSSASTLCNGNLYLTLTPDSSKGVPPYQYEIISGPQTFTLQSQNYFQLSQPGVYRVRLIDKCGNSATTDVTVANNQFPPLATAGGTCINSSAQFTYGSSQYFSFSWKRPNGSTFVGDTLIIPVITAADTGIYTVTRTININGCTSTTTTTFHLPTAKTDSINASICNGEIYHFGSKALTQVGIYRDTISTSACDSIVILNLTLGSNCSANGTCSGATHVVWKDDFGSGVAVSAGPNPNITGYTYQNHGVGGGSYYITNLFNNYPNWLTVPQDHTPNDSGGYFLVIDGGNPTFYSTRVNNLCPNTTYTFSSWAMNMDQPRYPSLPTFVFNVKDTLGNVVGQLTSSTPMPVQSTPTWVQNGFTFNSGNNTSLNLSISFTSSGYNDFAFDDLEFSVCGPTLNLTSTSGTCPKKATVTAAIGSGYANPVYEWYKKVNGSWVVYPNSNVTTFTDNIPDSSNWYRVIVSDGASACSFIEDSINVIVAAKPLDSMIIPISVCQGQSVLGHDTAGDYILGIINSVNGCDSAYQVIRLTINPPKRDSINQAICQGESYTFGTKTYNQTGIYRDTLSANGCDSIAVLNLVINNFKRDSINQSICSDQSFLFGNKTLNQTGIYRDTVTINGCDSITILNLTVTNCTSGGSCIGAIDLHGTDEGLLPGPETDYYSSNGFTWECWFNSSWYNNTDNTSHVGQSLLMSEDGVFCEDIVLAFGWATYPRNSIGFGVDGPGQCGARDYNPCYYVPPGGFIPNTWYHVAGVMDYANHNTKLYLNGQLVDTKTNTQLPFSRNIATRIGTQPVQGDSAFDGKMDEIRIWNYPRSAAEIAANYNQCLTGNESGLVAYYHFNEAAGAVAHDITPNHKDITLDPTIYWDKTINAPLANNCDNPTFGTIDTTICTGTYLGHNATGAYVDTLTNYLGCDSIRTLNLTVGGFKMDSTNQSICEGQIYTFGIHTLTQSGVYRDTIPTSACDSISILNLTVNTIKRDSNNIAACGSYAFGNKTLTQSGIYRDTIPTSTCDSISILNLTINTIKRDSNIITTCASYTFGNKVLTQSGIYRDTIPTFACDSISVLNLTINNLKRDSSVASICKGQTYLFAGNVLSQAGIYRDTIPTSTCDSIVVLNLKVNDYKQNNQTVTICPGQSYKFGNRTLTAQGIYKDTLTTNTCDSIATLNLIVSTISLDAKADKYSVIKGDIIHLDVTPSNFITYAWSADNSISNTTARNPTSIVDVPSWYRVTVTDVNNCSNIDSFFVQVINDTIIHNCTNTIIYIPTAFTPNGDGSNDYFRILGITNIAYRNYYLMIYNRWGNKVFESQNPSICWDGRYNNQPAETGSYVYYLKFTCEDGTVFVRKGNIVLLR